MYLTEKMLIPTQIPTQIQMMKLMAEDIDVAEVYSSPRIAVKAAGMGLKAGWGLDLTVKDHDGRRWDFYKLDMGKRAMENIKKDRPPVIIGSPTCTGWSTMMDIKRPKMKTGDVEQRMKEARTHLRFCVWIYQHQVDAGR